MECFLTRQGFGALSDARPIEVVLFIKAVVEFHPSANFHERGE
jgi:hypothetical protein